ncbi:MAG: ADP-heptose--LPS heptosyltransferase [Parvibaculum sp.]|jgi:ADP-heptose:LPS heptosyltransferase|uniref:glycosyltransferase family 9 protein n=1 Tax=Parvibaculum sp. TaxID=2024848 RepID=UPI000C3FDF6A|nr:glycosyltransferase family 9 protein [Parvibaculum sp.]MAU61145.1 ADP-heptose--LPS heptosyltransferase [Parvibaculum sp.]HAC57008.1 ADP-heptose--LPS heptosyltransferase [Rhodobiaceae bacterium]|tara:strand:+ start:4173 stop:5189 length:1017 start_codon:yes stop_codon:yes gene_type:complete
MSDRPENIRRVAVFSGAELLGDGLFKLPFLRSLRATFPRAEIVWLTAGKTAYAGILKDLAAPYLSRVIEETGIGRSPLEILLPRRTDAGPVDIAIDTQTVTWRSLAVKRALKPRLFIASSADYLFSGVKPEEVNREWTRKKPAHFVDGLMRLVDLASRGHSLTDPAAIAIPEKYRSLAAELLPPGPRYVGLAPGSGDPTKRWPLTRFIALAREASARGRQPVFFIGPSERFMLDDIRAGVPGARFPEDEAPEDAPRGPLLVAALGQRLDLAVANDSGLGHMLAISEVPLILLYGRHSPAKYAPRTPHLTTFWAQDFGGPEHERIPLEKVVAALDAELC